MFKQKFVIKLKNYIKFWGIILLHEFNTINEHTYKNTYHRINFAGNGIYVLALPFCLPVIRNNSIS